MPDPVSFIDNSPLFRMLTEVVLEGPGMLMRGVGKLAEGATSAVASIGGAFGSVTSTFLGSSASVSFAESRGNEVSPSYQPEITKSIHEVSMADLGNFAPPSFNSAPITKSTGVSI